MGNARATSPNCCSPWRKKRGRMGMDSKERAKAAGKAPMKAAKAPAQAAKKPETPAKAAAKPEKESAKQSLVIGTRGSALALTQSNMMADALRKAHKGLEVRLEIIKTTGDA